MKKTQEKPGQKKEPVKETGGRSTRVVSRKLLVKLTPKSSEVTAKAPPVTEINLQVLDKEQVQEKKVDEDGNELPTEIPTEIPTKTQTETSSEIQRTPTPTKIVEEIGSEEEEEELELAPSERF
jgi:hypothetical protein